MSVESEKFKIEEAFCITGRGVAVILNKGTDLNVGKDYLAELSKPDGTQLKVTASKEWLLRRDLTPPDSEAFMLVGIDQTEILKGTTIKFYG